MTTQQLSVAQQRHLFTMIWIASLVAIAGYAVTHVLLGGRAGGPAIPVVFPAILAALSVAEWAGAWWWHARTLQRVEELIAPTRYQRLSPSDRVALQRRLLNAVIVALALMGAPAVYGLVNSLVPSPYPRLFEWLAGGSAASLLHYRLAGYPRVFSALEKLQVRDPETVTP